MAPGSADAEGSPHVRHAASSQELPLTRRARQRRSRKERCRAAHTLQDIIADELLNTGAEARFGHWVFSGFFRSAVTLAALTVLVFSMTVGTTVTLRTGACTVVAAFDVATGFGWSGKSR